MQILHYLIPLFLLLFYPVSIFLCRITISIMNFLTNLLMSLLFRMSIVLLFLAVLVIGVVFIGSWNTSCNSEAVSMESEESKDEKEAGFSAGKICTSPEAAPSAPSKASLTIVFMNPDIWYRMLTSRWPPIPRQKCRRHSDTYSTNQPALHGSYAPYLYMHALAMYVHEPSISIKHPASRFPDNDWRYLLKKLQMSASAYRFIFVMR
ncbi:hypothetical protein BZA77DRAFT_290906 [Pyronema omphalodes]|nr:hypothetical protein BZA77DRAFT_290906 [Pyronema omphalodes]